MTITHYYHILEVNSDSLIEPKGLFEDYSLPLILLNYDPTLPVVGMFPHQFGILKYPP